MDTETVTRPAQASADLHASIDLVQGQLVEFDKINAGLAALEQAHPKNVVCNVATVAGMKQAIAGRAAWRDPRVALEKARKAAKAPVLALGKQIDKFASDLEVKLLEGESNYDEQIKAEEARREAERAEKLRKEAERVESIHRRIHEVFVSVPSMLDESTSAELQDEIRRMVAIEIDAAVFQEQAGAAALAKDAALGTLRRMQEKAAGREAEAERLKAEREELERQRAEQARIDAAARAEREAEAARLREERAVLEAQRAEARRQEDEERAARQKADREDRARREEEERQARAARAAEEKRLADERAALESQQREQRQAEERRQAEARRVEQARLDAEAAERRRQQDEEAAARRQAEEARLNLLTRVHEAAPQMVALLTRWQTADKSPRDKAEQQAVRVARDELLAGLA